MTVGNTQEVTRTPWAPGAMIALLIGLVGGLGGALVMVGVAGYQQLNGPKAHHKGLLWGMYVRETARNAGLGKRLVEAVLGRASGRVEQINLTVVADNLAAQRHLLRTIHRGHPTTAQALHYAVATASRPAQR